MMVKMLALMHGPDAGPRHSKTAADICASAIVVGAKGLSHAVNKDAKHDRQASPGRDQVHQGELMRQHTKLRWMSSERMLADCMTKIRTPQSLVDMLWSGYLSLVKDEQFTAAKKKDKKHREKS